MVDKRTWQLAERVLELLDPQKKNPVCLGYLRNLRNGLDKEIERLKDGQEEKEEEKEG